MQEVVWHSPLSMKSDLATRAVARLCSAICPLLACSPCSLTIDDIQRYISKSAIIWFIVNPGESE